MAASNYHQSDFRGGEWAPLAQGRSEVPAYRTALNLSINQILVEEGPATRRSGTEWIGPTAGRTVAKLLPFQSEAALPYVMEFTNLNLQFYANTGYVCTNDRQTITASSSAAGVLSLTTTTNSGFAVGDTCILWFPTTMDAAVGGPYRNRVFKITAGGGATTALTLKDDLGVALPYDSATNDLIGARVLRIFRFVTTYATADLPNLRAVQAQTQSVILTATVAPQVLTIDTPAIGDADPEFDFEAAVFVDGPYLDQQGTFALPEAGTTSAYTGSITFTPLTTAFVAADVGRHIRLFSEPPAWLVGTTYTYGQTVKYKGAYWSSIATGTYAALNVGVTPGTTATSGSLQITVWAPAPNEGQWAWGTISSQSGTACVVALQTNLNANNGTAIAIWRLGLFQAGTYPTNGVYHEGRLWLAGKNRFDASTSNDLFTFSPTDIYGTVLDSSGISETLNADELNTILWMAVDHLGIIFGTLGGEWLISASTLNDPLTPTSIQAHRVTKYGASAVAPVRAGMALIFVQRYKQRLMEYLSDTFSGRFSGRHINEYAKHITAPGITEICYQEEKVPVIWTSMADGSLAGTSYRRVSHFVTEAPVFSGSHRHQIGSGARLVQSMCSLPNSDGLSDLLYVCTYAPGETDYAVEVLRPIFEDA
jgi:hypothetical protein